MTFPSYCDNIKWKKDKPRTTNLIGSRCVPHEEVGLKVWLVDLQPLTWYNRTEAHLAAGHIECAICFCSLPEYVHCELVVFPTRRAV